MTTVALNNLWNYLQGLAKGNYRDIDELFSEWDEENSSFSVAEPNVE